MSIEYIIARCFGRLAKLTGSERWKPLLVATLLLPMAAHAQAGPTVALPDHVIGILPHTTPLPRTPQMDPDSLTVCVMLNLSDQSGFDAFEKDFNDPSSPNYHKTINAYDLTARFGPTQEAYDTVLAYLQQNGFTLAVGSANRLTITVRGARSQVEAAFNVHINDYVLGYTTFHANDTDPSVPQSVAPLIRSIVGLSNLSQPKPASVPVPKSPMAHATAYDGALTPAGKTNKGGLPPGLDGTGQTIGLIEYDNYDDGDVKAWLSLVGLPSTMIDNVTRFPIDGGRKASNGTGTREVLLDIDAALGIAQGANIIVFVSSGGSNLTTINAAIGQMNIVTGGIGGILSSSWSQCELAVPKAEAKSLDAALRTAALSGLTFFADSGDGEATCAAGVPDGDSTTEVHYPANVPHAVAVGGTTLSYGPDSSYGGETWWNNAPRGGSFGVSTYFKTRPSYQDPYTSASGRSVPDISADAGAGIIMCQASVSSTCHDVGGTSLATPTWASIWAIASQAITDAGLPSVSASGGYFYKMPNAFHAPSTMTGPGNDFSHVGLGSPDIAKVAAMAVADALEVESISPIGGSKFGGTTVTITGKGFIGVEKVTFGGVDATNVTIYSDSKLTADSPASASDQVDIRVVTPAGETAKSSKDVFLYVPQVTKVSPNVGPLSGGTTVTVTGRGFSAKGTSFDFGWAPATKVTCASSTECTMLSPAWGAGPVQVTAKTAWGTSPGTTADYFTYQSPVFKSFTPAVGPTVGGMTVNITGVGLSDLMTVHFGVAHGTGIFCGSSSTSCSVVSPTGSVGSVPLTVTSRSVTSAPASHEFSFALFPTVTAVSPNISAPAGTTVQIYGTNFSTAPGGTTFTFGTQPATSVTCGSTTQCAVVVPVGNGVAAVVPVEATVNRNTSLDAASFTYGDTPIVPVVPCKTCHV